LPAQNPKKTADGPTSPELAQQIKLIAADLATVRRNIGQLAANQDQFAAKQEQMNQNIAMLQQVEQDVRQQVLAPPALKPPHPPAHNPPQSSAR
jgi:septal ring factor EnvC (AmiA/AmiB activator)